MKLHHLSHTDLDGYGAHLVTSHAFEDVTTYNANYGYVEETIEKVLEAIKNDESEEEILFLISDLNLTPEEGTKLDSAIKELQKNGKNVNLKLLDHHVSGEKTAEMFDWYHLDETQCGTKITYEHFKDLIPEETKAWLKDAVDKINAYDLWIPEEKANFEFGKVMDKILTEMREVSQEHFPEEFKKYLYSFIEDAVKEYGKEENGHISLDEDVIKLKKRFFNTNNRQDTSENIIAEYNSDLIMGKEEEWGVEYDGKKGMVIPKLGKISVLGNTFLSKNGDYEFIISVRPNGGASFRSIDRGDNEGGVNVNLMAKTIAKGGGHHNASGGSFEVEKGADHAAIVKQIQDLLKNAEAVPEEKKENKKTASATATL